MICEDKGMEVSKMRYGGSNPQWMHNEAKKLWYTEANCPNPTIAIGQSVGDDRRGNETWQLFVIKLQGGIAVRGPTKKLQTIAEKLRKLQKNCGFLGKGNCGQGSENFWFPWQWTGKRAQKITSPNKARTQLKIWFHIFGVNFPKFW